VTELVFVVKASKFCNLRCLYCYEHRELHLRDRIGEATLVQLFSGIDAFGEKLQGLGISPRFSFVWHGGEPLLLPPEFYRGVEAMQSRLIQKFPYRNGVQTNLYRGTGESVAWCLSRGWQVGVSIDFANEVRATAGAKESNEEVLRTAESLHESGASFGVVSVLGRHNRDVLPGAYDWIERFAAGWRILPVFSGGPDESMERFALAPSEVSSVLLDLMQVRARARRHVRIDPLDDYIRSAVLKIVGEKSPGPPQRELLDNVYVVNVNGDVFTRPFAYASEYCIGNINDAGLFDLLEGEGYARCKAAVLRRKTGNCVSCRHAGYCDTAPVHEHGSILMIDGRERCAVPQLAIEAVEAMLRAADVHPATIGAWAREWLEAA